MANEAHDRQLHVDSADGFARRLREAREQSGLTLRELSFPGCTAPYISAIEHGRRIPSLQIIQRLGERLNVSPQWLATGQEDRSEAALVDAELALRLGDGQSAESGFIALVAEASSNRVRARAHAGLGAIRFGAGDVDEAIAEFEAAFDLEPGHVPELVAAVELLGRCYASRGQHETAVAVLAHAREQALEAGDRIAALRYAIFLTNTFVDLGDLTGSASTMADALREATELADPVLRARLDWTQSRLHTVEGRHDLAADFARRALGALQAAEDEHAIARAKQMLAYIELERGNAGEALKLLDEAAPEMARLGAAVERASFDLERGRALLALDRIDEAREVALDAMPVLLANAKGNGGRGFSMLGDLLEATGERESALQMFDAAIEELEGHRSPHLTRAFQRKAEVLERLGRRDEAYEAMKRALESQHSPTRTSR